MSGVDPECKPKFEILPDIISDWLSPYIDLATSTILDFGCGNAITAAALAVRYPDAKVYGVDLVTSPEICLASGIRDYGVEKIPDNLKIMSMPADKLPAFDDKFDLIYSWSALEHLSQDIFYSILCQLKNALKQNKYLFTQIAPLFFSPFGSHLESYIREPWAHLTMQQNLFFAKLKEASAEANYPDLCSLYNTLNRLTPKKFLNIMSDLSFEIVKEYYTENAIYSKEGFEEFIVTADNEEKSRLSDLFDIYDADTLFTEQLVCLHMKI